MGWLEFDRAEEAIKEGKAAVQRTITAGGFRAITEPRILSWQHPHDASS